MATNQIPRQEIECKHEVELAIVQRDVSEIKEDVKAILYSINGNGEAGLKTEVALCRSHTTRLYLWLSGLSAAFLGYIGLR